MKKGERRFRRSSDPQALFIRIFSFSAFAAGVLGDAAAIKGRAASCRRKDRRLMREDLIRSALHCAIPFRRALAALRSARGFGLLRRFGLHLCSGVAVK